MGEKIYEDEHFRESTLSTDEHLGESTFSRVLFPWVSTFLMGEHFWESLFRKVSTLLGRKHFGRAFFWTHRPLGEGDFQRVPLEGENKIGEHSFCKVSTFGRAISEGLSSFRRSLFGRGTLRRTLLQGRAFWVSTFLVGEYLGVSTTLPGEQFGESTFFQDCTTFLLKVEH